MLYVMLHTATAAVRSFRASVASTISLSAAAFTGEDMVREAGMACGEGARDYRFDGKAYTVENQSPKLPSANPISKRIALLPRSPRQPLNWQSTMAKPGGSVELA